MNHQAGSGSTGRASLDKLDRWLGPNRVELDRRSRWIRPKLAGVLCAVVLGLILPGCSGSIPFEKVPEGWALDVHQPGEWWTQPLIPRAVVVQRCPPPPAWASDPDLTKVTALPPGGDVEYSMLADDYHCSIGWSEPAIEVVEFSTAEMTTEAGLRRICSSSGLPMDASWRYLGQKPAESTGDFPGEEESDMDGWRLTTAAFIDDFGTVVACMVNHQGEAGTGASIELSVGADVAPSAVATCPVKLGQLARDDDGTLSWYQLRGAGAVRGGDGRVLTEAATLRIGVAGDSVTTSPPVVDGIAIVDAWVGPEASVHFEWEQPPPLEGQIYGEDGSLLATCRG